MRVVSIREPERAGADPRASARAMRAHRLLLRFALAAANVFAWIFVFQHFAAIEGDVQAFARVILLYALSQTTTALSTPLFARFLRYGARRLLAIGALLAASAFVVLGAVLGSSSPADFRLGAVLFAVLLGLYRAAYWIPYETEAGHVGTMGSNTMREILIALMPLFAGLYLAGTQEGSAWLLYSAAALIILSVAPLSRLRDVHERFSWGYRETFAACMAPENRAVIRRAIFEGGAGAALLLLWPIAVFLIVGQSFGMLGMILSLTFIIAIVARRYVRRAFRRMKLHDSMMVNALLVVSPWLMRLAVATPLGIVLVDAYFYTTSPKQVGIDPLTFEQRGDAGHYMDEYTAIKEIGLSFGRIGICIFAASVMLSVSLPIALILTFSVAGLFSVWSAR
ncbi:MAG: hypothetical protein NUV59_03990 [Patescibacteria group bacterium]|nr:hypothetical protein [Patescibacteria group bacterium]